MYTRTKKIETCTRYAYSILNMLKSSLTQNYVYIPFFKYI